MRRIGDNARMDRPSRAAAAMVPRNVADDEALDDQALFWAALSHAAGTPGLTIGTGPVYRLQEMPEPRDRRGPHNEMAD